MVRPYVHWLKIRGLVTAHEEAKQFREIQGYLDRYPESTATLFRYEASLCDYIVKLECHQNWSELDLYANSGFHALKRLTHKPANIGYPQPFKIPERLKKEPRQNKQHSHHEER